MSLLDRPTKHYPLSKKFNTKQIKIHIIYHLAPINLGAFLFFKIFNLFFITNKKFT